MPNMNIKVLFIQRTESYEGQYAPEAVCCMDEFAYEDSGYIFEEECERQLKEIGNEEVYKKKVIEIEVDQDKIRHLLLENPVIKGDIKENCEKIMI